MAQLAGIAGVGIFVFVISMIFWKIIAATVGIRVSAEEEMEGLDIGEHGNVAYPDFVAAGARGSSVIDSAGNLAASPEGYRATELSKERA
jgi:Amt family ammonium transporter